MLGNKKSSDEKMTESVELNERQQKTLGGLHANFQEAVKRIEEQKQMELEKVKMEFQNLFNVSLEMILSEKDLEGQWVFSKDFKKLTKKE